MLTHPSSNGFKIHKCGTPLFPCYSAALCPDLLSVWITNDTDHVLDTVLNLFFWKVDEHYR